MTTTQNKVKELKSYKKALNFEKQLLEQKYNLENELRVFDVDIVLSGIDTFIHSYACGENNQETIVLLHGFGGSGLTFYKMIKQLSFRYRVFTLDFIGMGLSDRQNFNVPERPQDVINFFVNSIEQWRKALGLQKFKLAGHSFGGYMAANYATKYPQYVEEVFLLSPMAGTRVAPENDLQNEENYNKYLENIPFFRRQFVKYAKSQQTQRITPGELLKKWFIPKNYVLGKAVQNRLKITDKVESEQWKGFLNNVFKLPQSTENHIHDLIALPGAQARLSIQQIIQELPNKTTVSFNIYFGDEDWMCKEGCKYLMKEGHLQGRFEIIKNAGHQLPFDQPLEIANKINKAISYLVKSN